MSKSEDIQRVPVPAIQVPQWLDEWDLVPWNEKAHQAKPAKNHFYLFALPAAKLRQLSGIQRRTTKGQSPRSTDLGPQRFHDKERSEEIHRFARYGFPWSDLSAARRQSDEFADLRKPGWLPTAIIVNIIRPGEQRGELTLKDEHSISIDDRKDGTSILQIPITMPGQGDLPPLEVIDGQHRLWAFDSIDDADHTGYSLPVVAFDGLDRSWQAYLFWTINIRPKKINASLAFDLYPLLRTEDWLDKFHGHSIYRETRAQELTEALWIYPDSPWANRINMLGERSSELATRTPMVSQAAWIRSLVATFVKARDNSPDRIGGLFGAPVGHHELALPWSRALQAAFLISAWQRLENAIRDSTSDWAVALRGEGSTKDKAENHDAAFAGRFSLLTTDQGVRGVLHVTNDISFVAAEDFQLHQVQADIDAAGSDEDGIASGLNAIASHATARLLDLLAQALSSFDWCTAQAPHLDSETSRYKKAYRGSGGYLLVRQDLLNHIKSVSEELEPYVADVKQRLGYQ